MGEADNSIIEYWKKLKEKREWTIQNTKQDFILDDEGNVIYRSIDLSKFRVLSKAQKRRQNQQRKKEAAENNPISVLPKAYLYQNLVDQFGSECEVPEDEEALMTMFEPPEDIATYPGYPNLDGLGEDDANEAVKTFLVSWRKEEAQRRLKNMKKKKKKKKKNPQKKKKKKKKKKS